MSRPHEILQAEVPSESNPIAFHTDVDEKDLGFTDEKKGAGYVQDADILDEDEARLRKTEIMEARLAADEATDEEYRVEGAHDVAVKVLSTRDDPELKVLTFRMFFLGLGFSAFGAVLAQLYYFKPQTLSVSQSFLLIISYFIGKAWEKFIPRWGPLRFINPGPFNIKEHAAILIMCSTAAASATAIQVISVQILYYDNELNGAIAVFTLFGSQLIGYGFAGLLQEALVYPTITFWPNIITSATIFQALHFDGGLSTKRVRLFWAVFLGIFLWEIIPQWCFPLVGGFSIACLINHDSEIIRNVFGGGSNNEGMGFLSWSFDWNYIGSSCLYIPLWTQLNENIGICFTYILMCAVFYGNIWDAQSYPFMSQAIFGADGEQYNQSALLTNNKFDPVKYETIGAAHFAATNVLSLITGNLAMGATTVHVLLFFWDDIKPFFLAFNPWNKNVRLVHDEHFEKMKIYKKVPLWWFLSLLAVAFAMAQATNYTGNSHLPWWALIVILIISLFFTAIYSTTSAILGFKEFSGGLDGFYQMLTSYLVPGDPIANMYGVLYGSQPTAQGIKLLGDLKLGQYIKLAPRVNFLTQLLGCCVGALLNWVMMNSIISEQRPALLSISGTRLWSGQNAQSYNSNAIAWGALGPVMFCSTCEYKMVPISLAIGCFLPLPGYLLYRWKPTFGWQNINTGVIIQYSCYLSVGLNCSVNPSMVLGVFSQFYMRRYKPRAFTKYNYIVAGALDGGTQVISFILNLAVFGAVGDAHSFPEWWGNDLSLSADRCLSPA